MPFFLLLLLLIVCLPGSWPPPLVPFEPGIVAASLLTLLVVAISVVCAMQIVRRSQRAAAAVWDRTSCARRYGRMRARHGLVMIGLYGVALFVFGWGWVVQTLLTPPTGHGGAAT